MGLVRSVFSKSHVLMTNDINEKNDRGVVERKRWGVVRSYFCADELKLVAAEEASAWTLSCSEASVTQPMKDVKEEGHDEKLEPTTDEEETAPSKRSLNNDHNEEERAAKLIQSVSMTFLEARHQRCSYNSQKEKSSSSSKGVEEMSTHDFDHHHQLSTTQVAHPAPKRQLPRKAKTYVVISNAKEDWDPSTVTSSVSKMRMQHRLEATMKREKALAYAFSQQLRTFTSKKNRMPQADAGTNMGWGWGWLEKWVATQTVENSVIEGQPRKHTIGTTCGKQRCTQSKNDKLEVVGEEKESCGSNEVSVDGLVSVCPNTVTVKRKATRGVSRRKTVPSSQCPSQKSKVSKTDGYTKTEEAKNNKIMLRMGPAKIKSSNYLATN